MIAGAVPEICVDKLVQSTMYMCIRTCIGVKVHGTYIYLPGGSCYRIVLSVVTITGHQQEHLLLIIW